MMVFIYSLHVGEGLYWRDHWEIVTEESSATMGTLQGADFLEEGALID
jgi:hypothetical protein